MNLFFTRIASAKQPWRTYTNISGAKPRGKPRRAGRSAPENGNSQMAPKKPQIAIGTEHGDIKAQILWCPPFQMAEGSVLESGKSSVRKESPQSPWMCVPAGNGSQLPGMPILTTATNASQKRLPAGPVLNISDLPGHAQHLPGKVQDKHGWAARRQAPACSSAGSAPVGTLRPTSLLRLSRALKPEPWSVLGEQRESWGGGMMPVCRQGVVRERNSARGERKR